MTSADLLLHDALRWFYGGEPPADAPADAPQQSPPDQVREPPDRRPIPVREPEQVPGNVSS